MRQLRGRRTRKEHQSLHHGSDNGSRIVHCSGGHMTTATSFDLRQRKCLTVHVLAPRKFQHTRGIDKKRWQPFLPYCDSGSQPEHERILTSSHTFISLNSLLGVSERPSKSRRSSAPWGPCRVKIGGTQHRHGGFCAGRHGERIQSS